MNIIDRARFINRAILSKRVSYLIFFITARCNANCHHCFYYKKLNQVRDELSLHEIERLTSKYKYIPYVTLTGGEPFLRDDLVQIVSAFYNNSGTRMFVIPTNGSLGNRQLDFIRGMIEGRRDIYIKFQFSIDGIGDKHDEFRGLKGLYDRVKGLFVDLKELQKEQPRFSLDITTVLNTENEASIEEIIDKVQEDFNPNNHNIASARPDSRDFDIAQVSTEKYKDAINYLLSKQKARENKPFSKVLRAMYKLNTNLVVESKVRGKMCIPCKCGQQMIIINETGVVYPCELRPQPMGSLRDFDMDLGLLLQSKEARGVRERIEKGYCPPCAWECAIYANVLMNPLLYPRLIKPLCKEYLG